MFFPSGTKITFAPDADWGWFSSPSQALGSFSLVSNSGQFTVDLADQTGTKQFTFGVYNAQSSGQTAIATESITIQETTADSFLAANWESDVIGQYDVTETGVVKIAGLSFLSDGTVYGSKLNNGLRDSTTQLFGTWITGTFDPADYQITANYTSSPSGAVTSAPGNSMGTPLSLDAGGGQNWQISTTSLDQPTTSAQMAITYTITEIANPANTISFNNSFEVKIFYEATAGGGELL